MNATLFTNVGLSRFKNVNNTKKATNNTERPSLVHASVTKHSTEPGLSCINV